MPTIGTFLVPVLLMAGGDLAGLAPVRPDTVRVYFVRHGEAYSNLSPPPANMSEKELDSLTDQGRAQARAVGAALAGTDIRLILHSPTNRTRETALAIRGTREIELREERGLRRIDNGKDPSGKPLETSDRVAAWKAGVDMRPLEGESMVDMGQRVVDLAVGLRKHHAGQSIVCVTHSDPIAAFLGHLHGTPGPKRYPPDVPLASITVVDVDAKGIKELLSRYEAGHEAGR